MFSVSGSDTSKTAEEFVVSRSIRACERVRSSEGDCRLEVEVNLVRIKSVNDFKLKQFLQN